MAAKNIKDREAVFLKYLLNKMQKTNREYVYTNYGYVRNIARYKNIPGARYLIQNLTKKKLITLEERINKNNKPFLIVRIARPIVVKKLLAAYDAQNTANKEVIESKIEKTAEPVKNDTQYIINNNIINQFNHSEKKKTTIVQDMVRVYNEIAGGTVTPDKHLAPLLVAAFKQKFKTLERWREYLKFKIWGKIKDTFHFLREILRFPIISASLGAIAMTTSTAAIPNPEFTSEAAINHVRTLNESPACQFIRQRIIEKEGAALYFSYFTKARLKEADGRIVVCGENSFVSDRLNTQFRLEFEKYYEEFQKKHINQTVKMIVEPKAEREEQKSMAELEVIGRIGFKEVKATEKGQAMRLSVGESKNHKGADGKWQQETSWYNVLINGNERVKVFDSLDKGDLILARGDISLMAKLDQAGNPKAYLTVFADKIRRLAKAPKENEPNNQIDKRYNDDIPF